MTPLPSTLPLLYRYLTATASGGTPLALLQLPCHCLTVTESYLTVILPLTLPLPGLRLRERIFFLKRFFSWPFFRAQLVKIFLRVCFSCRWATRRRICSRSVVSRSIMSSSAPACNLLWVPMVCVFLNSPPSTLNPQP